MNHNLTFNQVRDRIQDVCLFSPMEAAQIVGLLHCRKSFPTLEGGSFSLGNVIVAAQMVVPDLHGSDIDALLICFLSDSEAI